VVFDITVVIAGVQRLPVYEYWLPKWKQARIHAIYTLKLALCWNQVIYAVLCWSVDYFRFYCTLRQRNWSTSPL
jgi:hypothetical protein